MKTVPQLITQFRHLDIRVWADKGDLCFSAPRGALSPALRSELAGRKAEILSFLEDANRKSDMPEEIRPVPRDQNLPLSFAQQRLWFLDQLEGQHAGYNIPGAMHFSGPLDPDILERALNEVIRRHESLRTFFSSENGQPVQMIVQDMAISLNMTDLSNMSGEDQSAEVMTRTTHEARTPFDLSQGPLIRAVLLRLGPEEHVLVINMHHIISDGWSLDLLIQEMADLYGAFSANRPSPLPDLPIQYADFAVWQRERLKGTFLETELAYWKKQLAGAPPLLELPLDRNRPRVPTHKGSAAHFNIPLELTSQLNCLARETGATLFMILQAAFAVLLSRHSGQDDVVTGTPIANRNHQQTEALIGFFANTLALRTDLSGNPSFHELIGRVRQTCLDAYQHQELPFEYLVETMQPERSMRHSPIFQVMFALQTPSELPSLSDIRMTPMTIDSPVAKFDLTLFMEETDQGLEGRLEYNTDIFEADTITRMIAHFRTLTDSILTDANQAVGLMNILPDEERRQIFHDFNDTATEYPRDKCLHELFEEQAERTPDAVAVMFEEERLTYRDLNVLANKLAHRLLALGIGPDTPVGICMDRSPEMVVGLMGILKAGGAYVPLDSAYPKDRLAFMLRDAGISVLLTQNKLTPELPDHEARMLCLDTEWDTVDQESGECPVRRIGPENLAYVIYTSGSTGTPKGVMIPHRAICNHMLWMRESFPLDETDRVLQKTPFSFDASVWEFHAPLMAGARLVMARPGGHRDGEYLVRTIAEQGITTLQTVPSLLRMLLETGGLEDCDSLKRLFCGGEALPHELQEPFFGNPHTELYNLYGPTEAAIDATFWTCRPLTHKQIAPIGRPIANTKTYVLDRHLQPVPIGVSGELHIGGAGLARGYLGRPELTDEKFIPDPFDNESDSRLYKTGDLVRHLPDGNIEFLGRIDHQVKFRGFRVEPGEIESVLESHPGVRKAVVLIRPDTSGEKRLTAYLVTDHESPGLNEVCDFLRQKLPDHMVPSAFVLLEKLPLTPNGKLDRRALPDPDTSETGSEEEYVAPRTSTEHIVAAVWGNILEKPAVGINDNFFRMGGHSLIATQAISRLRSELSLDMPIRSLFEFPVLKDFAEQIDMIRRILEQQQEDTDDIWEDGEEDIEF